MTNQVRWLALLVLLATVAAGCAGSGDAADGTGDDDGEDPVTREISYGQGAYRVADLHLPAGEPPEAGWPTVVLIHGGFWRQAYARDLMTPLAEDLAERGWAAYNLEYARVSGPEGSYPDTLADVAAGIDHLASLDAPLDLDRVAFAGHSAGGQLVLWAAGRPRLPDGAPGADPEVTPCAVVGQAPVADLRAAEDARLGDGAATDLLGGGSEQVPEAWEIADPVTTAGHDVPVLLTHGTDDTNVPISQSRSYLEVHRERGGEGELLEAAGDHFAVIDPADALWTDAVAWLDDRCQ